ncbi:hypothetical protein GCM10009760_40270 [Kitasatospora kazusensis]|uniref:Glycosyltransferase n=1 Tax=Kitasatospora kazusensis TaxID=407974 RepID=A0ABP5LJ96_9ACTN
MVDQQIAAEIPYPAVPAPAPRAAAPHGRAGLLVRAALPAALGCWLFALTGTRLGRMGDLGLLQALPAVYWLAPALLTVGFVAALRDRRLPQYWLAAYVLGLIAVIHATPSLLYPTLRYGWAWKHIAIIDAMLRHNGTVPNAGNLDLYNQWPGFFQLNALVLRVTGLHSALGYASWYPVIANVLLMGPLLLIYRTFTQDRRLIWGGVWLYFATSWIGQDYFSPQAFAYFLCLTVLALVLRQLAAARAAAALSPSASASASASASTSASTSASASLPPSPSAAGGRPPAERGARALSWVTDVPARGGWRPAPFLMLLVLIAAIVCSHPLTPLMLISILLLLALPRRNRRVVLPVLALATALTLAWDATVARPYISSNIHQLVAALASPDNNALPGLSRLGTPARDQVLASWVDRGLTATVLLLAAAAVVRHRWVRRTPLPLLLLGPLPLLLSNNYGGEMVFRAYLFALPAAAFLTATLLVPTGPRPGARFVRWSRTGVWCVCALAMGALLTGLYFGYYSKETMNYFTPQEVAASQYVAQTAPPGSRIVSVTADVPGGELRYDEHQWVVLAQDPLAERHELLTDPQAVLLSRLNDPAVTGPAYLILSRAQAAECRLTGVFPDGTVDRVKAVAESSPSFRPVFGNQDAVVYLYQPPTLGSTQP